MLAAAWADPEIGAWLHPPTTGTDGALSWIAGDSMRRRDGVALDLVVDIGGVVAGEIGFSSFDPHRRACLVGYWVAADFRGEGVASRALAAATLFVMETVGATAVVAECDPANQASCHTAVAAGFTLLGDHDGRCVYARRAGGTKG